jgi:hypothetical protein
MRLGSYWTFLVMICPKKRREPKKITPFLKFILLFEKFMNEYRKASQIEQPTALF